MAFVPRRYDFAAAFGTFVSLIPAPLVIGTIALDNGEFVKGFVCEHHAIQGAKDITHYDGWRAWLGRETSMDEVKG